MGSNETRPAFSMSTCVSLGPRSAYRTTLDRVDMRCLKATCGWPAKKKEKSLPSYSLSRREAQIRRPAKGHRGIFPGRRSRCHCGVLQWVPCSAHAQECPADITWSSRRSSPTYMSDAAHSPLGSQLTNLAGTAAISICSAAHASRRFTRANLLKRFGPIFADRQACS